MLIVVALKSSFALDVHELVSDPGFMDFRTQAYHSERERLQEFWRAHPQDFLNCALRYVHVLQASIGQRTGQSKRAAKPSLHRFAVELTWSSQGKIPSPPLARHREQLSSK
jgi:hypothetical protein